MAFPFTGRERERQVFRRSLLTRAGVVLCGEAGVGKSRLAVELARGLRAGPPLVVTATGSSSRIPLGVFAPHLQAATESFENEAALLAAASNELGGVDVPLVVDDAHHLDPMSATMVHQHLRAASNHPAVVTVRAGEPTPPAMTALWKDGVLERIDVDPLSEHATRRLIVSALEGPVEDSVVDELWRLSRGNALYLRHLVEGAVAGGGLQVVKGRWQLTDGLSPPPRLVDLLWERVTGAGAGVVDVLATLSVAEPLEFELLIDIAGADPAATAEAADILRVERSNRRLSVAAAHPLFIEVAAQRVGKVRLRRARIEVADAIAGAGMRRQTDLLRIAGLRADSGAALPLDEAVAAARQALALFDAELADRVLAKARTKTDSHEARMLHARALKLLQQPADAAAILEQDMALAENDDQLADAAVLAIDTLLFGGDTQAASDLADSILRDIRDPVARARVGTEAALTSVIAGNVDAAIEMGEPILGIPNVPDLTRLEILVTVTFAQPLTGSLRDVHARIDTGIDLAALEGASPLAVHQLQMNRYFAYQCQGRIGEAYQVGTSHYNEVAKAGGPVPSVAMVLADTLLERAEFDRMIAACETALDAIERFDAFGNRPHIHLWAATLAHQIGREDLAHRWERFAADHSPDIRWVIRRRRNDAWRAASAGDLDAARYHYDQSVSAADKGGYRMWLLYTLGDAIRLGRPALVTHRLERLSKVMDGETVQLFRRHAHALHAGCGRALDQLADRYGQLGWTLRAAEATADAARVYLANGELPTARRFALRASLASEGFTARTPALRDIPEGLTSREVEIARLAAEGLSNQQLADRLYLSIRTVENHLSRMYGKLELAGREQLGDIVDHTSTPHR